MGKYDNVTMKEYMEKKKEILDDLGRMNRECFGVNLYDCPFNLEKDEADRLCDCHKLELENPDKALEIVMEYEPKVDWSKVEVDTKVLVRDSCLQEWRKHYFAYYKDGFVWCYGQGRTSFTSSPENVMRWNYAKLYKGDE